MKSLNITALAFIVCSTFLIIWLEIWFYLFIPSIVLIYHGINNYKVIILSFLLLFIGLFNLNPKIMEPPIGKVEGRITRIYGSSIFVKYRGEVYYLMKVDTNGLVIGQTVEFEANFNLIESKDTFSIFVRSGGASYIGSSDVEVVGDVNNLRSNLYKSLLDREDLYANFSLALLYKTRTDTNEHILDISTRMGISHLFIVSGFHISLFFVLLDKMSSKVISNKKIKLFINGSITGGFLWMIFMPYSGIRAFLTILTTKTTKYSGNQSLSIVALMFFIYNPWLLFSTSLILSFGITYAINLILKIEFNNNFEKTIIVALSAFAVATPIVATWNTEFNIFAPLFTVLLTPIVSSIYILLIFTIPFSFLHWLIIPYLWLTDWLLYVLDNIRYTFAFNQLEWKSVVILLSITFSMYWISGIV